MRLPYFQPRLEPLYDPKPLSVEMHSHLSLFVTVTSLRDRLDQCDRRDFDLIMSVIDHADEEAHLELIASVDYADRLRQRELVTLIRRAMRLHAV